MTQKKLQTLKSSWSVCILLVFAFAMHSISGATVTLLDNAELKLKGSTSLVSDSPVYLTYPSGYSVKENVGSAYTGDVTHTSGSAIPAALSDVKIAKFNGGVSSNTWLYYVSGVLYCEFVITGGNIQYRWMDDATASLGAFVPFGPTESAALTGWHGVYLLWSNIDVYTELKRLSSYASAFSGNPATVNTYGRTYTLGNNGVYVQRYVDPPVNIQVAQDGSIVAFIAPANPVAVLVREGCEDMTVLKKWKDTFPNETIYPVNPKVTCYIPTSDGTASLATDIYLPVVPAGTKVPTILVRTQYGRAYEKQMYMSYAHRGYALVFQDVRGVGDTSGTGMVDGNHDSGGSSGEYWYKHYEVDDANVTLNWISAQLWSDGNVGMGGASYLGSTQWAAAASGNPALKTIIPVVSGSSTWEALRPGGARGNSTYWNANFLSAASQHPNYDSFWKKGNAFDPTYNIQIPMMIVSGWFDGNVGTTHGLDVTANYPAGMRKVIVGPWGHGADAGGYDKDGIFKGCNALRDDIDMMYLLWYDHFVRGINNGIDQTAAVEYYSLDDGQWNVSAAWPPPHTDLSLYLGTNQMPSDGVNSYDYDSTTNRYNNVSFTTPPMKNSILIIGGIDAELFLSSTSTDTDFYVKLEKVDVSGNVQLMNQVMLAAKYRNGFDVPTPLTPNAVYPLTFHLPIMSYFMEVGSKLRITVASSYDACVPNSTPAHNTVHIDATHKSRVIIPVKVSVKPRTPWPRLSQRTDLRRGQQRTAQQLLEHGQQQRRRQVQKQPELIGQKPVTTGAPNTGTGYVIL